MKATYRRWECECGEGEGETVEIEVGDRPANLPDVYSFPHSEIRCQCGTVLTLVETPEDLAEVQERLNRAAPQMLNALEYAESSMGLMMSILDRRMPGWRQHYLFHVCHAQVREAITAASNRGWVD